MGKPMMTLAPLLPAISPMHQVVPTRWGAAAAITVDGEGIIWDGIEVGFHQITTVAYATRSRTLNLVQRRVERRVHVSSTGRSLAIELATAPFGPRHEDHQRGIYRAVVEVLYSTVEPRLRAQLIREIAAGSLANIGPLEVTAEGVRHRDARREPALSWEQIPIASLDGEHVTIVAAAAPRRDDPTWVVEMIEPNAVLLPELFAECAEVFC